jgi:hypothetical protein
LKKKTSQSASKKVLGDYKKIGAKFVPPIVHRVGPWSHVSWSRQTMPELIWWDALSDRTSHRFSVRVAEEIAKYFKPKENRKCWWAFATDYSRLDANEMEGLKEHLRNGNILHTMVESLGDFLTLYPRCPVSRFLDFPPAECVDINFLDRFEKRMNELEDKRSRSSILIQAQVIYMGFMLGKLSVRKGLSLADFPEVQHYPTTERSQEVGASICAAVNGVAGTMLPAYSEDAWVLYFWQRSLELRPLDLSHLESR